MTNVYNYIEGYYPFSINVMSCSYSYMYMFIILHLLTTIVTNYNYSVPNLHTIKFMKAVKE